jgi:hypothetical protein
VKAIVPPIRTALLAAALAAMAASCAPPRQTPAPAPPPPPAPRAVAGTAPAPAPALRPPANWIDMPATPGDWTWGIVAGRSTASYGRPGMVPLVTLACDKGDGEVWISRVGTGTGHVPAALSTTTGTRPLVSDPELSSEGRITIAVRATDPVLDAIAFSRGRFAFDLAGNQPLYLPSWPEVGRVIEDCR